MSACNSPTIPRKKTTAAAKAKRTCEVCQYELGHFQFKSTAVNQIKKTTPPNLRAGSCIHASNKGRDKNTAKNTANSHSNNEINHARFSESFRINT
jgi:hypothetical protein